jgi:hypothetical protein
MLNVGIRLADCALHVGVHSKKLFDVRGGAT